MSRTIISVALGLNILVAGVGTTRAAAGPSHARAPVVTRAALAPALVAGRGANADFAEQEAENAATNGTVIRPGRSVYTLPAEASGRRAVKLLPGQYVEFTLPAAANAVTVRYSIPDAPTGGGMTAPLTVTVNGGARRTMTLTSQYAWLYNQYSFSNDPNADLLHPDWWLTECSCVPAATTPAPVIPRPFRPGAPAFLLLHGDDDRVIPPAQTLALHHALLDAGADSIHYLLAGAGHGRMAFNRRQARQWTSVQVMTLISDFLDDHLRS
jgi:hypothetical protein